MTDTPPVRGSHRADLLDAAEAIVTEQGVNDLTLDRVAARAGITKGGLIYHFRTKEALLQALVERALGQIESRYQASSARNGQGLEALLTAMIDDVFDMNDKEKTLMANLLSAVSSYPTQLGPVQQMYERQAAELTQSPENAGLALMVSCALDGLLFLELLGLKRYSDDERRSIREALTATVKRALPR